MNAVTTTDPLKLLIVEDEALVAMLIEDTLIDIGHSVVGIADRVAEAIRIADRDRPDMALCDVKLLDGESGITVAEELAERGIVCLFVSGNCPLEVSHPLIVGCVAKPFRVHSIAQAVREAHAIAHGRPQGDIPLGMTTYR